MSLGEFSVCTLSDDCNVIIYLNMEDIILIQLMLNTEEEQKKE